ncbi:DNA methyltransferase [Slackia isoflavoniconvertens]|uniref:DNA methyltransferase n=1 Tax=Slackia isoflavoniconvertens TaxID=572010 RepID=UPI00319E6600
MPLTCPEGGIVLDPFVGAGTTCRVAQEMGRKSVGIESSAVYMRLAREGCNGNASFNERARFIPCGCMSCWRISVGLALLLAIWDIRQFR